MTDIFHRRFGTGRGDAAGRDVAALVAPLAAPAIHVVKTDAASRSHFGGSPDLPPGVPWPERDGERLGFLARLSLAEIHGTRPVDWLPGAGALLFFYDAERQPWGFDPKDRGGAAVLHVPDLPRPSPRRDAGPERDGSAIPLRNVSFRGIDVLPSPEREPVRALGLSDRETDQFVELAGSAFQGQPRHQVSGFPAPAQGDDMELECQLVTHGLYCGGPSGYEDERAPALAPGAADWRLLLQFDSDDDLGVMWGDCGLLYYWVEDQAARAGNFANTWLVLQCS